MKMQGQAVLLGALTLPLPLVAQSAGSLSGTVVAENGTPISGATIVYTIIQKFNRDRYGHFTPIGPFVSNTVKAGPDGRFLVGGLPPGDYNVCGFGTQPNHVGSCEWGGIVSRLRLDVGMTATANLTVRSGVAVTVNVNNPSGSIFRGSKFLIGVITDSGYYRRARLSSSGPRSAQYTLTVPKGISVHLFIDSDRVVIDAAGKPLETGCPTAQQISTGTQDSLSLTLLVN